MFRLCLTLDAAIYVDASGQLLWSSPQILVGSSSSLKNKATMAPTRPQSLTWPVSFYFNLELFLCSPNVHLLLKDFKSTEKPGHLPSAPQRGFQAWASKAAPGGSPLGSQFPGVFLWCGPSPLGSRRRLGPRPSRPGLTLTSPSSPLSNPPSG